MVTKLKEVINSTIRYCLSIVCLQLLHLPCRKIKDTKGILSNHLIAFLQLGQKDDFKTTPMLLGSRYMQTLAKLPQIAPSIINNKNSTN